MTAEILIAITAGIIISAAFLLFLWEKDRTRRHAKHKPRHTSRLRNVTSKRIAS